MSPSGLVENLLFFWYLGVTLREIISVREGWSLL